MNKKFFTLMAAALLGGAAMPSEAFATDLHKAGVPDSIPMVTEEGYADYALANGLKFLMGTYHTTVGSPDGKGTFAAVQDSLGVAVIKGGVANADTLATVDKASIFEIRNYDADTRTFNLYYGSKQVFKNYGGKSYGKFLAYKNDGTTIADSTNFAQIKFFVDANTQVNLFERTDDNMKNSAYAYTRQTTQTAAQLNANEGESVRLNFPSAATGAQGNPFGEAMIAIPWNEVAQHWYSGYSKTTAYEDGLGADSVLFVVKNDAGKAFAGKLADKEKMEAATFIVVDPLNRYNIQGFTAENGAGQKFTTVLGKNLVVGNSSLKDKKLENVTVKNALFDITEVDELNAPGQYLIGADVVAMKENGDPASGANEVAIAAYSPAEGAPYYVTTIADGTLEIVLAEIGGSNYADTKKLLKTDGQALYNVFFCGTKPSSSSNWYGKYLLNTANQDTTVAAPAEVADLTSADAVYIAVNAGDRGKLSLMSARNLSSTIDLTLYTTDEEGVYSIVTGEKKFGEGAEKIKLIPATLDAYVTLSEDDMKQNVEFAFSGKGVVAADDLYMTPSRKDTTFLATTDATKSYNTWTVSTAKTDTIVKRYEYAILKDGIVTAKQDSIVLNYYSVKGEKMGSSDTYLGIKKGTGGNTTKNFVDTTYIKSEKAYFVFKSNYDGTTNMILLSPETHEFTNRIASKDAYVLGVDLSLGVMDSIQYKEMGYQYCTNVVLNLASKTSPSLPAVSRHATIIADGAGISMKENKDGLLEGIISDEPLTFWLDTADSEKETPKFYFSKGIATTETKADDAEVVKMRYFLYNAADSVSYWDADNATVVADNRYKLAGTTYVKAIFRPAALVAEDTILTVKAGEPVYVAAKAKADVCEGGLDKFQFTVTEAGEEGYYVKNGSDYLFNLNGKLGFTSTKADALIITLGEGDATANEAIEAETGVQVIGGQGAVTVQGAAGKVITVANILGQTIANQVAASDNVTIAVPAGIVVVAVEGEATKVVVK